ncbi:uncharacterized protein LOC131950007 isoform X3 [Physella acuta]|uniref:uncharacterized protein LOC131950007 isoform X3 n=1 Tax=Physella acuta TaxID=109671 RepID=UPI0027DD87B6|nr:uncharacterized protein LOC131950007 isoform X3 [Physella acuta]
MAMNYHMEARRRQRFMERVCEARKRLAAGAAAPDGNDQRLQCGMINSCTSQSDPVISTDQGQFYQSRAVAEQEDENVEQYPLASFSQSKKTENVPKLNPCPPSLKNIKRDNIYKILHPHTDY